MKKIDKIKVSSFKALPNADKILLLMEYLCYFLVISTLVISILIISYSIKASLLLLLISIGFVFCAIDAKKANEYVIIKNSSKKNNNENYEMIRLNNKALKY